MSKQATTGKQDQAIELPTHGAAVLPSVTVDSYSLALTDDDGFIGDKASKGAFWDILEKWRKPLKGARRGPPRRQVGRRDRQDQACRHPEGGRAGSSRRRPERHRGVLPAACRRHPEVSARQGVARHRVSRHRRRLQRQQDRGAGRGPGRRAAQGQGDRHRSRADPLGSRRGRLDRLRASAAGVDAQGSRRHPRRRRRRHQYQGRRRRAEPQEGNRPWQG